MYASCLDGTIYEFEIGSSRPPRKAFQGHVMEGSGNIHVKLKMSPDKKYLISGSTDGHPRIYPINTSMFENKNKEKTYTITGKMLIKRRLFDPKP